jgi:hypothetical protein
MLLIRLVLSNVEIGVFNAQVVPALRILRPAKLYFCARTFMRSVIQNPISGTQQALLATCFHAASLLGVFFDPEDGGDMFPRNVG